MEFTVDPVVISMLAGPAFSVFFLALLKYKQTKERARKEAVRLESEIDTQLVLRYKDAEEEQKRQARLEREREARQQERPWETLQEAEEREAKKEQKRQAKLERELEMDERFRVMEEKLEREKKERIEGERRNEMMMKSLAQTVVHAVRIFLDLQQRQLSSSSRYQRLEYHERVKLLTHFELPEDSDNDLQNMFDASYLEIAESSEQPNCARNIEDDILCVANLAMTTIKGQKNSQDITVLELHNQLFDDSEDNMVNSAMIPTNNAEGNRAKEEGNAYFKELKFEEAIECYSKSINELPTVAAYGNRAMAYIKLNKFIEAEQDCTDALNIDDRYFKAYARRAMARTKLGCNLEGALEDVEVALELESNNLEMKELHSEILSLKGTPSVPFICLPNLIVLLESSPGGSFSPLTLNISLESAWTSPEAATEAKEEGNGLFNEQKFEEAITCYSVSINKSPTAVAYSNRAMAYLKLNKLMDAENDCTDALKIDNQFFKAYARRAIARSKFGRNFKGAFEDVEAALNLEPNNQEMKELRAKLNEVLG